MYNYDKYNENNWGNHTTITRATSTVTDYGPNPFVVDIGKATERNNTFRTALWTGKHLQLTLMNIPVGEDIGLEIHLNNDQFLCIEDGRGLVQMGNSKDNLYLNQSVDDDSAIFIPAGTWHNITNTGNEPLKLYSIYAPSAHPKGTVHQTKAIAEADHRHHFESFSQNTNGYFLY